MNDFFFTHQFFTGYEKYIYVPSLTIMACINLTVEPVIFLASTTGYKVFKKWVVDTQRLNNLQKAQLQDELIHLRNQVNPHFLFNTLNNLNTLVLTNAEKASQVILGLSDVLRYQIYESMKEKILLKKDVEMLTEFLMLEKIRRDNFRYEIILEGEMNGILIPPLLFINFVENSLKHGINGNDNAYCQLKFVIEKKSLGFTCINSKPSVISKTAAGGFGIDNIKRRLDLIYGKTYSLELNDQPNLFTVNLNIPL